MKVVLLVLSGDPDEAAGLLAQHLPAAEIKVLTRGDFEGAKGASRLKAVRQLKPEAFAVFTERLGWQRGQNAFLALGALAGAKKSILFDRHHGWHEQTRSQTMAAAPFHLARETAHSVQALRVTRKELARLEKLVNGRFNYQFATRGHGLPKIIYLRASPGPGTQAGGAASHVNGFINAASELGLNLSLITNDEIAGLEDRGERATIIRPEPVGSTRAAFDIYNNLVFTKRALAEITRREPDLIYQRYARFSWAGVTASLQTRRPLFLEYNGSEVWVGRYWDKVGSLNLLARFEKLNLKAAARIFVVSEVERQNLLRAGVEAKKIVVNPNGVNPDRFKPGIGGEEARQQLGISREETLVGFVGTFGPWHGVEVLARAVTLMPPDSKVRFLLIGSGALRSQVEETLRAGKAEHRAIFTGVVPHERVPKLLDACDLLVSPHVPLEDGSDFFGSPTKLFEYMAMGKAIVASRLGQIGEVLADEETALLIEPGNAQQLADAILRLSKSADLRGGLGAAARRAAIEQHTWKQNAQRVLDAYRELTEEQ